MTTTQTREATAREACQGFATRFDTVQVRAALVHAESGRLTWTQVLAVFTKALTVAVEDARTSLV